LRSPKQQVRQSCAHKQLCPGFSGQQTSTARLSRHDDASSPRIQAIQGLSHAQVQRLAVVSHVAFRIAQPVLLTTFLASCDGLNRGCAHELRFNAPIQFFSLFPLQKSTGS